MKKNVLSRKTLVVVAVVWGLVLAVSGVINGNQSFAAPDMKKLQHIVIKEKISSHALNCWITNQRTDFMILEFAKSNQCSSQYASFPGYTCFSEKALNNPKWMRNAFKNIDKQLIVFGNTSEKSLDAAATFKKHGYVVRMLDNEQSSDNTHPKAQSKQALF